MTPIDRNDHEAVLARIVELEADNMRLAVENDALRAPERIEEEPRPRTVPMKDSDWLALAAMVLLVLVTALYQACT